MFAYIQPHADSLRKISSAEHSSFLLSPFCIDWNQQGRLLKHFLVWKGHINEAVFGNVKPIYTSMGMFPFEKQHSGSLPWRTLVHCYPILKAACHLSNA